MSNVCSMYMLVMEHFPVSRSPVAIPKGKSEGAFQ